MPRKIPQANGQPDFSLNDQKLKQIVGDGCTPRKLLADLATRFEGGTPESEPTSEFFLRETWDQLEQKAEKANDPAELGGHYRRRFAAFDEAEGQLPNRANLEGKGH